eukprot:TRINITY_DN60508_c0_g1_i1.p2 TRINITY_DN60508_c0_g1~~TRINITY_DN60508_c0_g1_i1.p2  ORF type:complete len:150 (-),score=17.54 TRINITY_DN60508_c0_g1_i1:416-865(-)
MIRRPPRSTLSSSSAASDVYKRQYQRRVRGSNRSEMASSGPRSFPGYLPETSRVEPGRVCMWSDYPYGSDGYASRFHRDGMNRGRAIARARETHQAAGVSNPTMRHSHSHNNTFNHAHSPHGYGYPFPIYISKERYAYGHWSHFPPTPR